MNTFLDSFDVSSKLFDCGDIRTSATFKRKAMQYVGNLYYDRLNKSKYSSIVDNLGLVYGNTYVSKKDILSFHLVESKIIHAYLGIQNLDKLFDEDFFNFEWDIHTQQDFLAHKHGYQRDHFTHQIRNLWMMDTLLENFGFYAASKEVLMDREVSPISRYVSTKCEQMLADESSPFARLVDSDSGLVGEEQREYREEFFYKYVIFAASYLSALFHDLGYPVVYFLSTRRRLSEYSPASYMFTHNNREDFDIIANKLSDSLLFTVESAKNIRKNMEPDKDGKYDHGVYSAIPFLLHFYESGLIYRLAPEKVCAIELAAIAIYNHNLPLFACSEDPEKAKNTEYYKPYFNQNPIAFLLRTCDDLQEWDRRYFEITGESDIMFCPKCHRPMMKMPYNADGQHRYGIDEPSPRKYQYNCGTIHGIDDTETSDTEGNKNDFTWMDTYPTRQENFLKRKIYLIRACDSVSAEKIYQYNDRGRETQKYILKVTVHYDLYRLLELSRFSFAGYRIKDLSKLKKRLSGQNYRFQSGADAAPEAIYVDYFLSANPITIKVKILEKWLEKKGYSLSNRIMNTQKIVDHLDIYSFRSSIEFNKSLYQSEMENAVFSWIFSLGVLDKDAFENSVKFYVCILLESIAIELHFAKLREKRKVTYDRKKWEQMFNARIDQGISAIKPALDDIKDPTHKEYTKTLVRDCFAQYGKELLVEQREKEQYASLHTHLTSEKEEYESLCKTESDCDRTISRYCYGDTSFNAPSKENVINYFSDLYLFYIMNEEIK